MEQSMIALSIWETPNAIVDIKRPWKEPRRHWGRNGNLPRTPWWRRMITAHRLIVAQYVTISLPVLQKDATCIGPLEAKGLFERIKWRGFKNNLIIGLWIQGQLSVYSWFIQQQLGQHLFKTMSRELMLHAYSVFSFSRQNAYGAPKRLTCGWSSTPMCCTTCPLPWRCRQMAVRLQMLSLMMALPLHLKLPVRPVNMLWNLPRRRVGDDSSQNGPPRKSPRRLMSHLRLMSHSWCEQGIWKRGRRLLISRADVPFPCYEGWCLIFFETSIAARVWPECAVKTKFGGPSVLGARLSMHVDQLQAMLIGL